MSKRFGTTCVMHCPSLLGRDTFRHVAMSNTAQQRMCEIQNVRFSQVPIVPPVVMPDLWKGSALFSVDTLVLSGCEELSSRLVILIKPNRIVFILCEHALRSLSLHGIFNWALGATQGPTTCKFDLVIGNLYNSPRLSFQHLEIALYRSSPAGKRNRAPEIRLFLRDSIPKWQHEKVQKIARRLSEEFGRSFPHLQVCIWRAHGTSQVEAELHIWQHCPWLIPRSTEPLRPESGGEPAVERPGSEPWCRCDSRSVADGGYDGFHFLDRSSSTGNGLCTASVTKRLEQFGQLVDVGRKYEIDHCIFSLSPKSTCYMCAVLTSRSFCNPHHSSLPVPSMYALRSSEYCLLASSRSRCTLRNHFKRYAPQPPMLSQFRTSHVCGELAPMGVTVWTRSATANQLGSSALRHDRQRFAWSTS